MRIDKLHTMPPGARELMDTITDEEVSATPEVQALQSRLDAADREHASRTATLQRLLATQEDARGRQRDIRAQLAAIEQARPALAKRILLGEAQDAEDAQQQVEVANLQRRLVVFRLAESALDADVRQAGKWAQQAGDEVADCNLAMGDSLKVARATLAMARWQA